MFLIGLILKDELNNVFDWSYSVS